MTDKRRYCGISDIWTEIWIRQSKLLGVNLPGIARFGTCVGQQSLRAKPLGECQAEVIHIDAALEQ